MRLADATARCGVFCVDPRLSAVLLRIPVTEGAANPSEGSIQAAFNGNGNMFLPWPNELQALATEECRRWNGRPAEDEEVQGVIAATASYVTLALIHFFLVTMGTRGVGDARMLADILAKEAAKTFHLLPPLVFAFAGLYPVERFLGRPGPSETGLLLPYSIVFSCLANVSNVPVNAQVAMSLRNLSAEIVGPWPEPSTAQEVEDGAARGNREREVARADPKMQVHLLTGDKAL